jgi:hypothetical protein
MNAKEKRKHPRFETTNLLNFVCCGEDGEACHQGMGRTLNVSETGILLETYHPIDPQWDISITIGFEEELVDIQGRVIFQKESKEDTYEAGIEFSAVSDHERIVLEKFIQAFEEKSN